MPTTIRRSDDLPADLAARFAGRRDRADDRLDPDDDAIAFFRGLALAVPLSLLLWFAIYELVARAIEALS